MRPNSDSSNYLSEPGGIFNLTNLVANAKCLKLKKLREFLLMLC